jgi:hypothetical protein
MITITGKCLFFNEIKHYIVTSVSCIIHMLLFYTHVVLGE